MAGNHSNKPVEESTSISRREFARRAVLGSAAVAAAASLDLLVPAAAATAAPRPGLPSTEEPKLSAESRAEAEEKISAILRKYGARLSDEQKSEVRRLVMEGQEPLELLRAYPLENSDEPATVLRPGRRGPRAKTSRPAAKSAATKKGA